jgi:hypothetical protein
LRRGFVAPAGEAVLYVLGGQFATPGRVDVVKLDALSELPDVGEFVDQFVAFRCLEVDRLVAAVDAKQVSVEDRRRLVVDADLKVKAAENGPGCSYRMPSVDRGLLDAGRGEEALARAASVRLLFAATAAGQTEGSGPEADRACLKRFPPREPLLGEGLPIARCLDGPPPFLL